MADTNLPAWTPSESKTTSQVVKYGLLAAAIVAGIYLWNGFAPSMVMAVGFLNDILTNTTKALWSAAGLLGSLWLLFEIFSTKGRINKLLNLYYWHLINSITRFFITIDPLSPIDERITSLRKDQETFEHNFEQVDSLIGSIKEKEADCGDKAKLAAQKGQAAAKMGKTNAQQAFAHDFGEYTKAAQSYAVMRMRLEPLSQTLRQVADACAITIQKLVTERGILKDKWAMQEAVRNATNAAGRILGKNRGDIWNMADQAEDVITSKYGEELGHLEHLKNYATPLMESIDLDNATYNEAMLQAVTTTGARMIESSAATPQMMQLPREGDSTTSPVSNFLQ